ncbi:MAG: thiamine-phosphate kinase [Chloroflexi bacterium RBG_16_56_11]|nr:MAG: thiamine-phosphate kinase [Chloroflexi bacterium RBG_16_56_11]
MKVSGLGEFGLIDLLAKMIADSGVDKLGPGRPLIGIGDDAAAWRCASSIQLATVDTMVQGVHFSTDTASCREIGWKSLAINLSDIAAMGGKPEYTLVALALPGDTDTADITALYEGMIEIAREYGVAIVGGNISAAREVSVTITVIGGNVNGEVLRRSTARPGDVIAVTGYLGSAGAGLEMLLKKLEFKPEIAGYLRNAFLHPVPRIAEGQFLVKKGVTTAIDVSDGLLSDLRHICEASRVSARVDADKLPMHEAVREAFPERAVELALSGGEDYELLFTGKRNIVQEVQKGLACPVTIIGEITGRIAGDIEVVDAAGKPVKTGRAGWAHF